MYKIGMTQHCDQRLKTYNLNFIEKGNFIYTVLVEDMHLAELITFIKLRDFRIYENKEFLDAELYSDNEDLLRAIEKRGLK
jgi:hypothetical protein